MAATGSSPKGQSNLWDFLKWLVNPDYPIRAIWFVFLVAGVTGVADVMNWHWPTIGVMAGITAVVKKLTG